MVEVHVGGPEDWFAQAYGDTLELTGKLQAVSGGVPAGVLARMTATHVNIVAR
jgi:hypothetical protein